MKILRDVAEIIGSVILVIVGGCFVWLLAALMM